jgi:ABC-2 type transport system ATP-binding protein
MYPDLTTGEYLELSRRLYGRGSPADVARVAERFGLGPHLRKMLAQLSGGFQRRLCLAAALLTEPEVLLLDEPTVGLDPVAAHEVHRVLREAMRGRTTVLCTHNLAEAEALCDEVVILRAGRVLLHEPLATLRTRAAPHLRLAARQGNEALATALRAGGLSPIPDGTADGVHVPLPDPRESAPDLLRTLLAGGLDVYECQPEQATLEQLFLEVVGVEAEGAEADRR